MDATLAVVVSLEFDVFVAVRAFSVVVKVFSQVDGAAGEVIFAVNVVFLVAVVPLDFLSVSVDFVIVVAVDEIVVVVGLEFDVFVSFEPFELFVDVIFVFGVVFLVVLVSVPLILLTYFLLFSAARRLLVVVIVS